MTIHPDCECPECKPRPSANTMTEQEAREAERKAVVETLWGMSKAAYRLYRDNDSPYFDGKHQAYKDAAELIERFEHLKGKS